MASSSWPTMMHEISDLEMPSIQNVLITLDCTAKLPSVEDFICILQKLRETKSLAHARHVHASICDIGLEAPGDLGNYLVPIFVDCGSILEAQRIFSKMVHRNQYSWTSLIQGHINCGEVEHALDLYQQMQEDHVHPSRCTFLALLKACAQLIWVREGLEIHSQIVMKACEKDPFVGSALVDMYAKFGLFTEAHKVFHKLLVRDVVLWTTLMAGYAELGDGSKALSCFEQMQVEGVSPTIVTFIVSLKACGIIGSINRFREIHFQIAKQGLEKDHFVGSTLVDMYATFGLLVEAQEVFDKLLVRDVISWNVLIAGYVKHQLADEGLCCYQQMQLAGFPPDAMTFSCSLRACGSIGALDRGRKIHTEIVKEEFEKDLFVGNSLVDMYVKCGSFQEASEVFNELPARDVVSWNTLIAAYTEYELGEEALRCFRHMRLDSVSPNDITFLCTLKACGSVGALERGQEIHSEIFKEGYEGEYIASNMLAGMDIECSLNSKAFLTTALIDMYGKCGTMADAQGVFDALPGRALVTWNTLMTGYTHQGNSDVVFHLFERMTEEGIQPDDVTFLCILTVCSYAGLVDYSHMHLGIMRQVHGVSPTIKHHSCMVDLLGRAGQLDDAVAMAKKMPFQPDVVTWSTMLGACQKWGNVELGRQAHDCALTLDETHYAAFISMFNIYAKANIG